MQDASRYEFIRLELKYCELCGALWFRPADLSGAYCGTCEQTTKELAASSASRRQTCQS